jgi:ligand-binding sensor domain-containing protein
MNTGKGKTSMKDHRTIVVDAEQSLADLAAELTASAYSVALRHAVGDRWLDLQLELWWALTETIKQRGEVAGSRMIR